MGWQAGDLGSQLESKVTSAKAVTQLSCADIEQKTAPIKVFQGGGQVQTRVSRTIKAHLSCRLPDLVFHKG